MGSIAFQGNATALSSEGVMAVADKLDLHAAELWAVLAVETAGCGYLSDRRPQILFERHIFHRLTNGQYDDGAISDAVAGGYGPRGAPQYDRLALAISKDRTAALQSTSWGIGQIMGTNYAAAGFSAVEDMVSAATVSEDQQLMTMANFLVTTKLAPFLQAHNWTGFARGYNGPNYVINRYDVLLNSEYQKYSTSGIPDLSIRAAQLYLTYLGYHPGVIDGIAGEHTLAALAEFQTASGISRDTVIDENCVAALQLALSNVSVVAA